MAQSTEPTSRTGQTPARRASEVAGRVISVNVGSPRDIARRGRSVKSAIWKEPTSGRVPVTRLGLDGDHQADLRVHGGPEMALYAYAREDALWWEGELGRAVPPGTFGENLTLADVAVGDALVGERWRVGTALVRVTKPRTPCWKLGVRMSDEKFPDRFAEAGRLGCYLGVVEEGEVGAGDPIRIIDRPSHPISIALLAHLGRNDPQLGALVLRLLQGGQALIEAEIWEQILRTAEVPGEYWGQWAERHAGGTVPDGDRPGHDLH